MTSLSSESSRPSITVSSIIILNMRTLICTCIGLDISDNIICVSISIDLTFNENHADIYSSPKNLNSAYHLHQTLCTSGTLRPFGHDFVALAIATHLGYLLGRDETNRILHCHCLSSCISHIYHLSRLYLTNHVITGSVMYWYRYSVALLGLTSALHAMYSQPP